MTKQRSTKNSEKNHLFKIPILKLMLLTTHQDVD